MPNQNTHTDPKTATAEIAQIAETLIARWETLVAEGEAEAEIISAECEDHLTGYSDYSADIWDANADLTEDEETWEAAYEKACQMWLAKYHTAEISAPTTEDGAMAIAEQVADAGYDTYYFADVAFAIAEGCDYDEECQRATDTIAQALGLPTLAEGEDAYDNEEYCRLNEFVNEQVTAQMADYED